MLCLAAAAAAAADGSERLLFHGPDSLAKLTAVAVGQGIDGVKASDAVFADGRVVWKAFRDETDDLGMRHVFYRQHLLPSGKLAEALGEPYAGAGIRILGGEVGLHYRVGRLVGVFGTQVKVPTVQAAPSIGSAEMAMEIVDSELARWPGYSPDLERVRLKELADAHREAVTLVLDTSGNGGLRLVWQVPTLDAHGVPFLVSLDAATGALISVERAVAGERCQPDSTATTSATAMPEIPWLPARTLAASPATTRPGWQYEAHWFRWSPHIPSVEVYMGRVGPHACIPDYRLYVLTPLKVWGPMGPRYVEYSNPADEPSYVPGHAAGDALYHTIETMETLLSLGWNPRLHLGTEVRITVDTPYDQYGHKCRDNAFYYFGPGRMAPGGPAVCPKQALDFRFSASLDVVAHEWGHGVVQATAGWPFTHESDPGALHEGFADVIAHATEWARPQPLLPPDWTLGEDSGRAFRDLTQPDGSHSFHRAHFPREPCWLYCRGNRLGVAFRLLSVGGRNPLCPSGSCPAYPGAATVVPALGVDSASRVLLRTLTRYATSTTTWEDLPLLARIATFDLFAHCPTYPPGYSAEVEQDAVAKAFTAIGYASEGYLQCVYPEQQQP